MKSPPARTGSRRSGWLLAAALAMSAAACDEAPTSPDPNVPIEQNYGTKIVYGTSQRLAVAELHRHCRSIGGTFNQCGTICAPGAATCATVCAFTCEDIPQ